MTEDLRAELTKLSRRLRAIYQHLESTTDLATQNELMKIIGRLNGIAHGGEFDAQNTNLPGP